MKHYFSTSSLLFLLFISINILSSCRDQNYDWNAAKKDQRVEQYEESFKSIFGDIDPQQSWDFSTCGNESATRASVVENTTRTDASTSELEKGNGTQDAYPADLGSATVHNLTDTKNNSSKGKSYRLFSSGKFKFSPYFHGACTKYNFCVEAVDPITGQTVKKYAMNQNTIAASMSNNYNTKGWSNDAMETSDVNGSGTRGFIVDFPVGMEIKLYLENPDGAKGKSLMLTDNNIYKHIPSLYTEVIMLDQATKNDGSGDNDYNDLCVLISVDEDNMTPPVITTTEDFASTSKRYMVEDLGSTSTSDLDFNDIVVDFSKTTYKKVVITSDKKTISETTEKALTVVVRALGGTLDFQLLLVDNGTETPIFQKSTAGTTTLSDYNWDLNGFNSLNVKTMYCTGDSSDPLRYECKEIEASTKFVAMYSVKGELADMWDPAQNNIRVRMIERNQTGSIGLDTTTSPITTYDVNFPNTGEVPAMVAFSTSKIWRLERDGLQDYERIGGSGNWFTNSNN